MYSFGGGADRKYNTAFTLFSSFKSISPGDPSVVVLSVFTPLLVSLICIPCHRMHNTVGKITDLIDHYNPGVREVDRCQLAAPSGPIQ